MLNAQNRLDAEIKTLHELLQAWAMSGSLAKAANDAFQLDGVPPALKKLIQEWSRGDFSSIPETILLSGRSMPDAAGAYALSTGTIYINQSWLDKASNAEVLQVLTEELGHHLDAILNSADSPGDEGELFARLLLDANLSASERETIRAQILFLLYLGRRKIHEIRCYPYLKYCNKIFGHR